jgi:hypothetical protein
VRGWRAVARSRLARHGFSVTAFTPPADGTLLLQVDSSSGRHVARGRATVRKGRPARIRGVTTPYGKRLLRGKHAIPLAVFLDFIASQDRRDSGASLWPRLPARRS